MQELLPKIYVDYVSFFAGILVTIVLIVLIFRYRKRLVDLVYGLISQIKVVQEKYASSLESDYTRILYRYVQGNHLARDLFSLEKILVPPKCIAPPPDIIPGVDQFDPSLLQQTLGYDPASPEFSVKYKAPSFTLIEALSTGSNICLLGKPGTGKTVAIADCVSTLIKDPMAIGGKNQKIPFLVNSQHLLLQFPSKEILTILLRAIQGNPVFSSIQDFPKYLTSTINENRAILFIDGLDSLSPQEINQISNYIIALCKTIPSLQILIACSPFYIGNLYKAPLKFVTIAPWSQNENHLLLEKWSLTQGSPFDNYEQKSASTSPDEFQIRNALINISDIQFTPLEFTLKVWSAYAGDITGGTPVHALDSYLARYTSQLSPQAIKTLETIAFHTLEQEKGSFSKRDLNTWSSGFSDTPDQFLSDDETSPSSPILQTALTHNILQRAGHAAYFFSYPTIAGFLAAKCLGRSSEGLKQRILKQTDWGLMHETMRYFSAFNPIRSYLEDMVNDPSLFKVKLIRACQWLAFLKPKYKAEEEFLLRAIIQEINSNPLYLVKYRLATGLATSGNSHVGTIFRRLLQTQDLNTKRIAALGSGFIQDLHSVPLLINQLNDPFPASIAACYALGQIGSPNSLEAIAECLLHGNELLRRSAAESLAHNRSEGHPALREGISRDDLLVRYAVVHGLSLIPETWAIDILDKMRIDEDEWVVRDLAQQLFEVIQTGSPYLPVPYKPAYKFAWLHSFAEQHNIPAPTPETALELILNALENGTEEQKQASLQFLRMDGSEKVISAILNSFPHETPEIKNQAELALWFCTPPGHTSSIPV